MKYNDQLKVIQSIPLLDGDSRYVTCPFCYGLNKMSISKVGGKLMWNCFRASCNSKGVHQSRRSLKDTKDYLSNNIPSKQRYTKPLPTHTTAIDNHKPALDYLKGVNSLEAYKNGFINIRYSPSDDRVLFYYKEGAVGRSLNNSSPKWMTYGNTDGGIFVGRGTKAVLVEDVASACSVSRLNKFTGVALLGTNLTDSINNSLPLYDCVYLALDKDASKTAITTARNKRRGLKLRILKTDLKLLSHQQILELLV
jgi:hypothetical protein